MMNEGDKAGILATTGLAQLFYFELTLFPLYDC
jgi:hypothetical protein